MRRPWPALGRDATGKKKKEKIEIRECLQNLVQNHLSSSFLSKNVKSKVCRNIILLFVLYGCETWSLMLREEHRLRVFENRVLRRMFGLGGTR